MLIITMAISLNAGYANEGGAAPKAVSYARIYCESFCDEPVHRVTGLGESLTRINLFTDTGERYRGTSIMGRVGSDGFLTACFKTWSGIRLS